MTQWITGSLKTHFHSISSSSVLLSESEFLFYLSEHLFLLNVQAASSEVLFACFMFCELLCLVKEMNWLSGSKILPEELHFHCLIEKKGVTWRKGLSQLLREKLLWNPSSRSSCGCNLLGIVEVILDLFSPCLVELGLTFTLLGVILESPSSQPVLGKITGEVFLGRPMCYFHNLESKQQF